MNKKKIKKDVDPTLLLCYSLLALLLTHRRRLCQLERYIGLTAL